MSIRTATADDAPGLHRLAALTFPLACTPQTPRAEIDAFITEHLSAAVFEGWLASPSHTVLVATHRSEPVGYAMLVTGDPADPEVAQVLTHHPTVELSKMYVDPAHHGDGTAHRLVVAALATAPATGAAGIWLGVSEENARANAFYARHGFERVGTKRFHIGDRWEDDLVLEQALPTAEQVSTGTA